ncbi:uncharacterized protein V1510DRAFT_421367 [Dipodascopsis tothii]|uniref:uncharacterized protein n=1 Tax=Dipodascopsis tothii TaxID=44089 RepID=UPI0034CFCF80
MDSPSHAQRVRLSPAAYVAAVAGRTLVPGTPAAPDQAAPVRRRPRALPERAERVADGPERPRGRGRPPDTGRQLGTGDGSALRVVGRMRARRGDDAAAALAALVFPNEPWSAVAAALTAAQPRSRQKDPREHVRQQVREQLQRQVQAREGREDRAKCAAPSSPATSNLATTVTDEAPEPSTTVEDWQVKRQRLDELFGVRQPQD